MRLEDVSKRQQQQQRQAEGVELARLRSESYAMLLWKSVVKSGKTTPQQATFGHTFEQRVKKAAIAIH